MSSHLDGNTFAGGPDDAFPESRAVKRPRSEPDAEEPSADEASPKLKAQRVAHEPDTNNEAEPSKGLEEGEDQEVTEAEDTCRSLLSRVARLEATQRKAARQHRFLLGLAAQENEALLTCAQDLRRALIALQQQRRTGGSGGTEKEQRKERSADPAALARLLLAHENAAAERRWEAHIAELRRCAEAPQDPMNTVGEMNTEEEMGAIDKCVDDAVDAALAPLLPTLDRNAAALARALALEVRAAGSQRDAALQWAARCTARAQCLEARVRGAVVTSAAAEQPLLEAQRCAAAHIAARDSARRHAESEPQRNAARRRVERAELALAALFAAGAGRHTTLPHTAQPHNATELEGLCALLSREIVYLRRVAPALSPVGTAALSPVGRGRDALLRHCCAALTARLAELTRRVALSLLCGTAAAPPTAAQDALLLERRAHVDSQRALMHAFIAENARLQRRLSAGEAQAPLLAEFAAALDGLRAARREYVGSTLRDGSSLRATAAALALRLRLSHAMDRVRLAEGAVAVGPRAAVAVAAALEALDGASTPRGGGTLCAALSALRPVAANRETALVAEREVPRAALVAEAVAARAALAARREDAEWCRRQCPQECAAELREAVAEIARLRAEIQTTPARDAEAVAAARLSGAQLRIKAKRCREQWAAAEEQWRRAVEVAEATTNSRSSSRNSNGDRCGRGSEEEECGEEENEGGEEGLAISISRDGVECVGEKQCEPDEDS